RLMDAQRFNFGVIDNRFLAKSLGFLNPPPPVTLNEAASVEDAINLLREHKIGSVAITDAKGKLVGIFTERDVVLKVCLSGIDVKQTPIAELMTRNPKTAQMTTTMAFALNMMSQGGYRHLPVVDENGIPLALVSVKNVVDHIVHALTKDLAGV